MVDSFDTMSTFLYFKDAYKPKDQLSEEFNCDEYNPNRHRLSARYA